MKFYFLLFILLLFLVCTFAQAQSSDITLIPKVNYFGLATFETINDDTDVPATQTKISGEHATTNDSLKWDTAYPLRSNGYPTGAIGVNVGGRSAEDTQVTTLGVPLNLPQGGGADFSAFPAYLWDSVTLAPTTSGAGFAPSASVGHVDFMPWTRASLRDQKLGLLSRATVSYDHDSQTYSLAHKEGPLAMVIGASTGLQRGFAGMVSGEIIKSNSSQVLIHFIGTDQTGDTPGSLTFRTPGATEHTKRYIPVIETGFKLGEGFEYQSTAFADLSHLQFNDPANASNSQTNTEQYGIENALVHGSDTFALSARYVRFNGASYGALHDFPGYAAFTHEWLLSDEVSLKGSINGTHTDGRSIAPGARLSAKFAASEKTYSYSEMNTVAKLPNLIDRYAQYPSFGFHGNPDLNPERVYAALVGYRYEQDSRVILTQLKAEYRKSIQILSPDSTTVINGGDAYLITLSHEFHAPLTNYIDAHYAGFFTYSKLKDLNTSYPDLPFATAVLGLRGHYRDDYSMSANGRLVGVSAGPGGRAHDAYTLFEVEAAYQISKGVRVLGGIDNLFGSQGQAVLDYPVEGRRFFAALTALL